MKHLSALYNLLKTPFQNMLNCKIQHVAANFVSLMTCCLKMKELDIIYDSKGSQRVPVYPSMRVGWSYGGVYGSERGKGKDS